jgi:hypothetical protein
MKKPSISNIIVNNKKYSLYKIRWIDIFGDASHKNFESLDNMQPAYKITIAYVFKKTKKFIHTFSTYDEKDEEFSDCNVFPKGVILEMKKIVQ